MERIQVNGVWYVREEKQNYLDNDMLSYTKTCMYETDRFSFEAILITDIDGNPYFKTDTGLYINFIDKRTRPFIEETWDNPTYFLELYHNQKDALIEASDSMDEEGIELFQQFIGKLIEMKWIGEEF